MIGNLILSLLAATFVGGIVAAGDYKADSVLLNSNAYNSTSHITGDDVMNYFSFEANFTSNGFPNPNTTYWFKYDENGQSVSNGAIGSYVCDDTLTFLTSVNNFDDDGIYLFRQMNNYVVKSRLLVPSSWNYIFNIEFNITGSFNYAQFGGMTLFKDDINHYSKYGLTNENGLLTWFGFHNGYVQGSVDSFDSGLGGFEFYEYGFSFTTSSADYLLHFDFLGEYSNSVLGSSYYQSGYNAGYNAGSYEGYSNGYADGIATATRYGTFDSLFNSIADTPLRFLYGIFNFDLFGMSMLIIVLTLLTGLIVFGIVKKFWK